MNYTLTVDLWDKVIPLSALVGAFGGFVWDIGNAIRRSSNQPATGLDNIVTLPRIWKSGDGRTNIELGLLGPILVGALAGILLVLLAGRTAPGAADTASVLEQATGTAISNADLNDLAQANLGTQVTPYSLFLFAAIGGLAGWPLLRAMTTRTSKLVEAAVGVAFEPASRNAKEAVAEQAERMDLSEEQKLQLAEAAESAVQKAAPKALRVTEPT